jgi:hypothetical protein
MGCASVYLSWTVYVIIYGMFLLVHHEGNVLRERGDQDFCLVIHTDGH